MQLHVEPHTTLEKGMSTWSCQGEQSVQCLSKYLHIRAGLAVSRHLTLCPGLHNMRIYEYSMTEISHFKAEFFKALAHPLRIRILDELRKGEVGVNDLCSRLDVEQSNLSQQLAVLRNRNILATRKDGQSVYYSVRDPQLFELLDVAKKIFNNHLIDVKDLLSQLVVARRG